MDNSTCSSEYWLKGLGLLLPALLLLGCDNKVGVIQGVRPVQPIPMINTPLSFVVNGSGQCKRLKINWGDSLTNTFQDVDLGSNPVFTHTFTGWGGGKTVTVEGTLVCTGKVNTRFVMEPSVFKVGFNQIQSPTAQTCGAVHSPDAVFSHSLVHITTVPATGAPRGINFGCPFGGCIYDADGKPGSVADSRFPFPGLKEYSLVLRISTQVVQGGTNMSFTSTDTGFLELCVNDSDMTNNTGGYEVDIRVDQLGP